MAKKKTISRENLIEFYMDYVLSHGNEPKSVYHFAKENNFEEQLFYSHFGSFQAIREGIFTEFYNKTLELLKKSDDFQSYDARNKLLSFYYTFFELLTANRSYVVYALKNDHLINSKQLKGLKEHFKKYITLIEVSDIDMKQEQLQDLKDRSIEQTAWAQMLFTLKFWLDDGSANFEKTDLFIEKAVNASFDLLNPKPLRSLIDLGKFLIKEKVSLN